MPTLASGTFRRADAQTQPQPNRLPTAGPGRLCCQPAPLTTMVLCQVLEPQTQTLLPPYWNLLCFREAHSQQDKWKHWTDTPESRRLLIILCSICDRLNTSSLHRTPRHLLDPGCSSSYVICDRLSASFLHGTPHHLLDPPMCTVMVTGARSTKSEGCESTVTQKGLQEHRQCAGD